VIVTFTLTGNLLVDIINKNGQDYGSHRQRKEFRKLDNINGLKCVKLCYLFALRSEVRKQTTLSN